MKSHIEAVKKENKPTGCIMGLLGVFFGSHFWKFFCKILNQNNFFPYYVKYYCVGYQIEALFMKIIHLIKTALTLIVFAQFNFEVGTLAKNWSKSDLFQW